MSMPAVPNTIIPTITTTARNATVPRYSMIISGFTIIPTEIKNTAPNRSFTGFITCSMRSACTVPANIEPITKAPSAIENPLLAENTAIAKHNPIDITRNISSVMARDTRLKNVGNTQTPTVNHITRKNPSRSMLISISPLSTLLLMATDDSNTIITTANRSSHISTANTSEAKRLCFTPKSLNALMIIVVDDIDNIPPKNKLSMFPNPSTLPVTKPNVIMPATITSAVTTADPPTFISFLKLNSSPSVNRSTTIPICAQNSIFASDVTEGSSHMCGLARNPATM